MTIPAMIEPTATKTWTFPRPKPPLDHFIAGGLGGTLGAIVTCPLEMIKTRLQSSYYRQAPRPSSGSFFMVRPFIETGAALGSVWRSEGPAALWKGVGANLVGVVPSRSKDFLRSQSSNPDSPLIHLASAAFAGVMVANFTNPIWVVKTRMQLQNSSIHGDSPVSMRFKNSFHCFRVILREEGIFGLYKGLTASYFGVIEGTIQWILYEKLKKSIREAREQSNSILYSPSEQNPIDWLGLFLAASASKLVAATFTYPHEVMRTRLRQPPDADGKRKYRNLFQGARLIFKEEGLAGLYGGCAPHLMRVVPNAGIMFLTYEVLMHAFKSGS